jgi:hypothetical protein
LAALAKAMAQGGVRAIKAFPLLGDAGSRLHKRERSISWDAVVVCSVDQPGRGPDRCATHHTSAAIGVSSPVEIDREKTSSKPKCFAHPADI